MPNYGRHLTTLASENEPDMRRLLHFYTSWSAMEDNECESPPLPGPRRRRLCYQTARSIYSLSLVMSQPVATARVLTQALSNTVTANETLVARLWESYMNLPEDQVVLMCVSPPYPRRPLPLICA